MKSEKPISSLVISGNSAWKPANTLAKAGMTKMLTMTMAIAIATSTNIG